MLTQDNALRSASAYADENNAEAVRLAFLDTEAFKRLIKDETIEIIKENMLNYENFWLIWSSFKAVFYWGNKDTYF